MATVSGQVVSLPAVLKHRYFVLRHGESLANVAKIIVSDPAIGVPQFGLSDAGRAGAGEAGQKLSELVSARRLVILSSDFKRAHETALEVRLKQKAETEKDIVDEVFAALQGKVLARAEGEPPVILVPLLRERYFGDLDGKSSAHYDDVWKLDREDACHEAFNAEPPARVRNRMMTVVSSLESQVEKPLTILIVSHGDSLQMLMTAFLGTDVRNHRDVPHLEPADLRELKRQPAKL
mmetsp:Transcript_46875/g.106298  ORF Transcript_46875/g.106298 Transcript_46875/m.106298 type:complete len:236 (-) Transcript_46875:327-1034(-)